MTHLGENVKIDFRHLAIAIGQWAVNLSMETNTLFDFVK